MERLVPDAAGTRIRSKDSAGAAHPGGRLQRHGRGRLGSLLIALLRHADRVTVACLAQLVNVIAPIMTEPGGAAWRQTTFFPFAQAAKYGRGEVLDVARCRRRTTKKYGEVDLLHATAVRAEDGSVTVFAVNRSQTEPLPLEVALNRLGSTTVVEHSAVADADPTPATPFRTRNGSPGTPSSTPSRTTAP